MRVTLLPAQLLGACGYTGVCLRAVRLRGLKPSTGQESGGPGPSPPLWVAVGHSDILADTGFFFCLLAEHTQLTLGRPRYESVIVDESPPLCPCKGGSQFPSRGKADGANTQRPLTTSGHPDEAGSTEHCAHERTEVSEPFPDLFALSARRQDPNHSWF